MDALRRIDLNLLVALDALLEERSVTRAARRLALTQSAVSGMLSRLREAFGDPLFVRAQRGLLPTPRAEALAPALRRLLEEASALITPVAFAPERWRGSVSISTTDYMQRAVLVPLVRRLGDEAPGLRVAVVPLAIGELSDLLARGAVDLAVTIPEFTSPDLPSRKLYRERYVAAMRSRHPLASKRALSLDDFCRFDHVLVSPIGGSFEGPVDAALARLGRRRSVRLSVPSFLLVPELLATGDLLAVVPERALLGLAGADLRVKRPPVEIPDFDVIAAWHPRCDADPAHRWLRERLAEVGRGLRSGAPW